MAALPDYVKPHVQAQSALVARLRNFARDLTEGRKTSNYLDIEIRAIYTNLDQLKFEKSLFTFKRSREEEAIDEADSDSDSNSIRRLREQKTSFIKRTANERKDTAMYDEKSPVEAFYNMEQFSSESLHAAANEVLVFMDPDVEKATKWLCDDGLDALDICVNRESLRLKKCIADGTIPVGVNLEVDLGDETLKLAVGMLEGEVEMF